MTLQINLTEEQEMLLKNYATECNLTVEQVIQNRLIELLEDIEDLKACEEYEDQKRAGTLKVRPINELWEELEERGEVE